MRNISKIILALLKTNGCFATDYSFFMTPIESTAILETVKKDRNKYNSNNVDYKVSGIFYIDESNWTVWINEIPYSSIGQQKKFSIDEVSENKIVLTMIDGATLELFIDSNCNTHKEKAQFDENNI